MKFFVDSDVFRILPDYCIGIMVIEGIDNHTTPEAIQQMLSTSVQHFHETYQGINLKEDSRIEPYRNAFRLININPNKYMCSIEALAKRVQKKPELPQINALVDIGNAISLKHDVPIGVHDIQKFDGDTLGVRFYEEGDHFQPMGNETSETPDERELLYVSGHTVKTRRWTWRQSDDGKITEDTKNAIIVIDGFHGINDNKVEDALEEMKTLFIEQYHITPKTGMVDQTQKEFEW